MTVNVRFDVPKGATWKVVVRTQTKKWDTEAKAYGAFADDLMEQQFLPGVTGNISIWDSKRISNIEEVPLTDAEKIGLGLMTGVDGVGNAPAVASHNGPQ